ncbi:hypothetical protein GCM10022232_25810 [Streptomyces plumbiresistens]|uniref:Uncharacterized protein n=1 Tax=Streptomyces plumbiresistens TaxID=511811 RepID=A0ABP7QZW3_9ACTN
MVIQRHFGNKIPMQAVNLYYLADGRIVGERRQPDLAQEGRSPLLDPASSREQRPLR